MISHEFMHLPHLEFQTRPHIRAWTELGALLCLLSLESWRIQLKMRNGPIRLGLVIYMLPRRELLLLPSLYQRRKNGVTVPGTQAVNINHRAGKRKRKHLRKQSCLRNIGNT